MSTKTVFHVLALFSYFFTIWYDINFVDVPLLRIKNDIKFYKGRLKFLTIWNLLIQAAFFTICLLNDLLGNAEHSPKRPSFLRRLQDIILSSLAFPLSMFVGLTFWSLYFVNRELVFPKAIDPYFPVWLNHAMHTNIMAFMLIEMCTSFRNYPARKVGLGILAGVMLAYLVWIHIIHAYVGMWVYPVLEVLNFPMRLAFFVGLLVLAVTLYLLGETINKIVWRTQLNALKKLK